MDEDPCRLVLGGAGTARNGAGRGPPPARQAAAGPRGMEGPAPACGSGAGTGPRGFAAAPTRNPPPPTSDDPVQSENTPVTKTTTAIRSVGRKRLLQRGPPAQASTAVASASEVYGSSVSTAPIRPNRARRPDVPKSTKFCRRYSAGEARGRIRIASTTRPLSAYHATGRQRRRRTARRTSASRSMPPPASPTLVLARKARAAVAPATAADHEGRGR